MHRFFSSGKEQQWAAKGCKSADIGCGDCKEKLTANIIEHLEPIGAKLDKLRKDPDRVWGVLRDGAVVCRREAATNLDEVRKAMGLR
jgi:tryptophanyl-tRNA synthetase